MCLCWFYRLKKTDPLMSVHRNKQIASLMCLMSGIPMSGSVFRKKAFLLILKRQHLQVFARRCWLGVCDRPLSAAAHVHACMSLWPGEGCALHFNIPSLTHDVCKGFSLFLFSDFPPRSPSDLRRQCLYLPNCPLGERDHLVHNPTHARDAGP